MDKNNQNNSIKVRLLMQSSNPRQDKLSYEIHVDDVKIPNDYQILGVQVKSPMEDVIDAQTNEHVIGTYNYPIFDWSDFNLIKEKFEKIMNASIVNKEQKQAIYDLLCEAFYSHFNHLERMMNRIEKDAIDNASSAESGDRITIYKKTY